MLLGSNLQSGRHLPLAELKRTAAFETLGATLGQDANAVTSLLWSTYRPYQVWYWFSLVGTCSLAGLLVFSQVSKRWKDLDV